MVWLAAFFAVGARVCIPRGAVSLGCFSCQVLLSPGLVLPAPLAGMAQAGGRFAKSHSHHNCYPRWQAVCKVICTILTCLDVNVWPYRSA